MASPSKRARSNGDAESESVTGYLHSVSPVKVSRKNNRYFEASLQTGREEYHRVVCFSPEKRAACLQARENHQAVKLVDCRKAISQSDAGGYDVMLTGRSRVEAAQDLPYGCRELRTSEKKTVAEILALGSRQKVGVVEVKVVQATGSRVVPLNGEPMEVTKFAVCDPTGQTSLSVWGAQIVSVQEGRSYRFESLATRKQADATVLTTTPSTAIMRIQEVGQPSSMAAVPAGIDHTVRGQVTGVQILVKHQCRRCHFNQEKLAQRSTTHRCQRCGILQLTKSYNFSYSGVLIVQGDGEEFSGTLTNAAVFKYVWDNFLSASAHDQAVLEEHVIVLGEVEVTTNGEGLVLAFASARSAERAVPAVAHGAGGDHEDLTLDELFNDAEN